MGKKLARSVSKDGVIYEAGTELPDGVTIDNDKAFEDIEYPTPAEQIDEAERLRDEERQARQEAAEEAQKANSRNGNNGGGEAESATAKPATSRTTTRR